MQALVVFHLAQNSKNLRKIRPQSPISVINSRKCEISKSAPPKFSDEKIPPVKGHKNPRSYYVKTRSSAAYLAEYENLRGWGTAFKEITNDC